MVSHSSAVDYYKELGLNRYSTSYDIRTAYKRLALKWHPDRNKAKDAEEKFKKIKQAYDVLIDENRRREYDQQQQQQQNTWFQTTTNMKYKQADKGKKNKFKEFFYNFFFLSLGLFNLQPWENLIATPIDPFDILSDIQYFQESDFTSKMMNSPSYRNLYTNLFNSMNDPKNHHPINFSTPIYLNNDRLFRPNPPKPRSKNYSSSSSSSKYSSINPPVIHSTMPNDWFLNELINLHEQQTKSSYSSFNKDAFFNDLTNCTNCHKKVSNERIRLIQHEQQCRQNNNKQYTTIPSKSVRV
jgi:curved DNA-binding protein CbpA